MTGPKIEASSYLKISEKIGERAENILFITDVPKGRARRLVKTILLYT